MRLQFRDTRLITDRVPGMVLALGIGLAFTLTACGTASSTPASSGAAGTPATQDGAEATPAASEDAGSGDQPGQPAGGGSATLTIGDQTWEFTGFMCAFGHEETQSAVYAFSSNAFGVHSTGARVQMQANIRDESGQGRYEGDGIVYEISLDDIADFENPSVSWSSSNSELFPGAGSGDAVVRIDGKHVTAEGKFDDGRTDAIETVAGTLDATCAG
jgi:hypothetical protein